MPTMTRNIFQANHKGSPRPERSSSAGDSSTTSGSKFSRKSKATFLDRFTSKSMGTAPVRRTYDSDEYSNSSSSFERLSDSIPHHVRSQQPSSLLHVAPAKPVVRVTLQPTKPLVIKKRSQSPPPSLPTPGNYHARHHRVMSAIEAEKLNVHTTLLNIVARPLPPLPTETRIAKFGEGHHAALPSPHDLSSAAALRFDGNFADISAICDCRVCLRQRAQMEEISAPTY